ncbi:MAG: hypothetical protein GY929_11670 [Actinomycetia bacterium]|nr:hypothetical protein [Actinomycetes bacterium]
MVRSARRDPHWGTENRPRRGDRGRTIVEAVAAMAIVLLAAASWLTLNQSSGAAQAATATRREALALARAEIDFIVGMSPATAGLDPTADGWATSFEGRSMVAVAGGLVGDERITQNGETYGVLRRVVLEESPGGATWKRYTVVVTWSDDFGSHEIRLDGGGLDGE